MLGLINRPWRGRMTFAVTVVATALALLAPAIAPRHADAGACPSGQVNTAARLQG